MVHNVFSFLSSLVSSIEQLFILQKKTKSKTIKSNDIYQRRKHAQLQFVLYLFWNSTE